MQFSEQTNNMLRGWYVSPAFYLKIKAMILSIMPYLAIKNDNGEFEELPETKDDIRPQNETWVTDTIFIDPETYREFESTKEMSPGFFDVDTGSIAGDQTSESIINCLVGQDGSIAVPAYTYMLTKHRDIYKIIAAENEKYVLVNNLWQRN